MHEEYNIGCFCHEKDIQLEKIHDDIVTDKFYSIFLDEDEKNLYLIIGLSVGGPIIPLIILFFACRMLKHGRVSSADHQVAMKNVSLKEDQNVEQTPVVEIHIGGNSDDKQGKENTAFTTD